MDKERERAKMMGGFHAGTAVLFMDRQACGVEPLCARPAYMALAGSRIYRRGLSGEGFIRGRANVQSNWYWSSTTNANNTDNAWNVNMNDGSVNNDNKDNNNYVWPVRSGEWSSPKRFYPSPPPSPARGEGMPISCTSLEGRGIGEGDIFSFENLYRCYLRCRENKRNTINALRFEANAEENLFVLSEELKQKTYKPSRSVCFIVDRPKMREIIAADFRDRIVHHLLVERLEAIYVVRRDYVLARRRVVNNLKAKFLWFKRRLVLEQNNIKTIKYDYALLEKLRATAASYWGHLKWADSYNLRSALLKRFDFLKEYFICDTDGLKPIYEYRRDFPLVKFQYLYYAGIFPDAVIFFQVGAFYEFYEELADDIKVALHLKPLSKNKRGAMYGFPVTMEEASIKRLLTINKNVIIVRETGGYIGKLKERVPVMKIRKLEVFE